MRWSFPVLLLFLVAAATAGDGEYCWPLDLETRYLTSNFLETRQGRFHTGIDLKTEERTGVAVLAVTDGWISRIKFAPAGYGKAVYLTDREGRTFVYAHLERLADPLRARVRSAQRARGRYDVDLYPQAGELPVGRGEVIALSGQTATSGPHLHFEVRDPAGRPLNPRRVGFGTADELAPEILAVSVWWGNRCYRYGDGQRPLAGALPELVVPPGDLGVSARLVERSDALRYRLEPYRVSLSVDDWGTLGAGSNDRVRWEDVRRERVVFRETDLGRERVFWAAGAGGSWLADGRGGRGPGRPDDPAGTRRIYRLVAADASGNRQEVWWPVRVDPAVEAGSAGPWRVATASEVAADQPRTVLDLTRARPGTLPLAGDSGGRVSVLEAPLRPDVTTPFRALGLARWLLPEHPFPYEQMERPLAVSWPAPGVVADGSVGLYRHTGGGWDLVAVLAGSDPGWTVKLDHPGAHILGRDLTPPRLRGPDRLALLESLASSRHGVTLPRWQPLAIGVVDDASGLDWRQTRVTLDGRVLIAEPDPPRDRLLLEFPDDVAPGDHELVVVVADRAGLPTRAELSIMVPDGAH